VIVIRIVLIPLFVKQIKASRGMQMLSPEMQAIQKKYKGKSDPASREAMSRETMELYKKHGTNPFASCLPILAQSPIFFALFRVLYSLPKLSSGTYAKTSIGPLDATVAGQVEHATIFGAPLSGYFMAKDGGSTVKIVTVVLIVAMSLTTFLTQRQLTMKNMPPAALEGPMAQQQKMLLYLMPLIFAFSGVNFPIGVLLYWTTTNLWSMGQQFYTIRRMPAPGSAAEAAMKARQARKSHQTGLELAVADAPEIDDKPRGQRVQPKRKDRVKPRPTDASTPTTGSVTPAGTPAPSSPTKGQTSTDGDQNPPAARAPRKPKK
jgi:YidC/Oxa1 family membrane protein insertase